MMFHLKPLLLFLTISHLSYFSSAAKILAIFPMPSPSHVILGSELLKGLATRGHEVTMLSSFPLKNPPKNYKDVVIDLDITRKVYESSVMSSSMFQLKFSSFVQALATLSEAVYESEVVLDFINSDQQFDVVIYFYCNNDSHLGMSHKFNASTILFNVASTTISSSYTMGHPFPSAYVPNFVTQYTDELTIWQRGYRWLEDITAVLTIYFDSDPIHRRLLKKYYPDAPSLEELRGNVDLLFLNSHITIDPIQPIFQNMINIGGFQFGNTEELQPDVKQFLDKSKNGVILVSFGSNLRTSNLNEHLLNVFINFLETTSYDVLWKIDLDQSRRSNVKSNIKTVDWLQQKAVLNHPKVKFFITHGGKNSLDEGIYYGVPMLIIPFYADQHRNAQYGHSREIGIKIDLDEISRDSLTDALKKLASDEKYRRNIQKRSELFRNQEMDPMEKAIYWIEVVIKNRGTNIFKTPASKMFWYQTTCLDFIAMGTMIILSVLIIAKICWHFVYHELKFWLCPKLKEH